MENMDAVRVVDQSWLPCGHTNTYTANDARVHVMTHSSTNSITLRNSNRVVASRAAAGTGAVHHPRTNRKQTAYRKQI